MKRREFTAAVAAGAVIPVAGCSDDGSDVGIDTSSPEAVVESYHEAFDTLDPDATADEILSTVEPAFHSVSPLPDRIRELAEADSYPDDVHDLASIEAEVVDENLGADRLNGEDGLGFDRVDRADVGAITGENAVVEADIEHEEAPSATVRRLTAPEGGDWLIVV